jgi:hypothetical protein
VLFNINTTTYNLFKGNTYGASGGLTFAKITAAQARAVEKGQDGKMLALLNPRVWSDVMNEQAALRKYDGSYSNSKAENGSQAVTFYSQSGEIQLEPSIYVKQGYGYLLNMDDWMRVGSSDITFKRPGQGDQFFKDIDNAAGYELRLYTDQALFCQAPGRSVLITGITTT